MKLTSLLPIAATLVLIATGCATRTAKTNMPKDYENYTQISLEVTEDQTFVIGNDRVTVENFIDKVEFDRTSKNIILQVAKTSKLTEETLKTLLKAFTNAGYNPTFSSDSKYAHLQAPVK